MEELNGVTIYWLISIGLVVGYVMEIFFKRSGFGMGWNLFFGVVGSLIVGAVAIYFELFAPLIYAAIGSVAFLFLINVFSLEPEHKEKTGIAGQ